MLTNFYKALQAWIEAGTPNSHPVFLRKYGICGNYYNYLASVGIHGAEREKALSQLHKQFPNQSQYPFDEDEPDWFIDDSEAGTLWRNPQRLNWVKQHANS